MLGAVGHLRALGLLAVLWQAGMLAAGVGSKPWPSTRACADDSEVFVFPLLPAGAAGRLARDADGVAARSGWRTNRHRHYATTDIEIRGVPELWARLEPLVAQAEQQAADLFGEVGGLSFHDVFVVKYSADQQRGLGLHQDGSAVTLQITLSEEGSDFGGGGTNFPELPGGACLAQPRIGEALVFRGGLQHEGLNITWGTRHVLVAFSRRLGAEPDDQNMHFRFGGAYQVTVSPRDADVPCFGVSEVGVNLLVSVVWHGCESTGFKLHYQLSALDINMYWIERFDPNGSKCEASPQSRLLTFQTDRTSPSSWDRPALFAFPPGHSYESYQLQHCPRGHWQNQCAWAPPSFGASAARVGLCAPPPADDAGWRDAVR